MTKPAPYRGSAPCCYCGVDFTLDAQSHRAERGVVFADRSQAHLACYERAWSRDETGVVSRKAPKGAHPSGDGNPAPGHFANLLSPGARYGY